jgi:hypothetical protein
MNRITQFTETSKNGNVQTYVMQYGASELDECFSAHERLWLSEGKIVEREDKHGIKTEIVDLQAWFGRTK